MSRLGNLTKDEITRLNALTFRMCAEDHWDVSACDCPGDCEYVQKIDAEVRAAVKKFSGINLKGECEMKRRRLETMFEDQMMEMGTLEDDESLHDCPGDCEDIQGECEMTKEPMKWTVVPLVPEPLPPLELKYSEGITATVCADGRAEMANDGDVFEFTITRDLRGLVASLQSILVLAEEHFGEDWGK